MKRCFCLLAVLLMLCTAAIGERAYLIPDSNSRQLTKNELWGWDYESLGYILNEIFARHGYVFERGGKYEYYFSCMPWYTPNANPNNSAACYPQLNAVEWYNEQLVKEVRADMRAAGTQNKGAKSVWTGFSTGFSRLYGFDLCKMKTGQTLNVYSAPSAASWRGANGKACVSTNGNVFTAGYESGWLLVMYETNNGSVRVGYADASAIRGTVPESRRLRFEYTPAMVTSSCQLTDDPARSYSPITTLRAGTSVTYLTTFVNNYAWDYIETTHAGKRVRAFIPAGYLDIAQTDMDE